jgi:hypothetical protein
MTDMDSRNPLRWLKKKLVSRIFFLNTNQTGLRTIFLRDLEGQEVFELLELVKKHGGKDTVESIDLTLCQINTQEEDKIRALCATFKRFREEDFLRVSHLT